MKRLPGDDDAGSAKRLRLEALAREALEGKKEALEEFVSRISDDVYHLALRMLGHPADAEDALQEILIKVVTHLESFRGESSIRTWVSRVAANHLISTRLGRHEPASFSFDDLERRIAQGLKAEGALALPVPETPLLEEE